MDTHIYRLHLIQLKKNDLTVVFFYKIFTRHTYPNNRTRNYVRIYTHTADTFIEIFTESLGK